jgi:prepilin-type processing-associated H-X9-DG protein
LIGPHTAFPDGKGLAPKAFSDGLSNTALVVEACGQQIIWTEPKDIKITATNIGINLPGNKPNQSSGIWSSYHDGQAFTLFADGSVRALNTDTDPQVL